MKKGLISLFSLLLVLVLFQSCEKEESSMDDFNLNITGLEDLGDGWAYEGWLIVDGSPVTTGVFTVDANGNLSETNFTVDKEDLENASTFVLTIEPAPDSDPAPSHVHILAGDFTGDDASLNIAHGAALGDDFNNASGKYILATPTDGMNNNENSGIWFLDASSGSPMVGLNLPTLPDNGWVYEGWAVIDGNPVSTGTFTALDAADMAAPYSGNMAGPPFPGEDFVMSAPSGLTFPTDLAGGTAVISIEPSPDNSPNPFQLKPLVGMIPASAADHTVYDMGQNLMFPTGNVTR